MSYVLLLGGGEMVQTAEFVGLIPQTLITIPPDPRLLCCTAATNILSRSTLALVCGLPLHRLTAA